MDSITWAQRLRNQISISSFSTLSIECCSKKTSYSLVYDTLYNIEYPVWEWLLCYSPRRKAIPFFNQINEKNFKNEPEFLKEIPRIQIAIASTWRSKRKKNKQLLGEGNYMEKVAYYELRPSVEEHTKAGRYQELTFSFLLISWQWLSLTKPNWILKGRAPLGASMWVSLPRGRAVWA